MNLSVSDNITEITFQNGEKCNVHSYLPIRDKIDLIDIAIQHAETEREYDPVRLEMYFNLYLVMMYTDIDLTEEDRSDLYELYDKLESNGMIDDVIAAMDENEYQNLKQMMEERYKNAMAYKMSFSGVINTIITELPKNVDAAAQIMEQFDPEKYKEVIQFAEKANANRPIPMRKDEKD